MNMSRSILAASAVLALCVGAVAAAQPGPGGRGPGFGGFGGGGLLMLARMEAVQKEIKATEDQIASIRKLGEEMRPAGGQNFRDMSQEEREKAMTEMRARMEKANTKLAEILKADQIARLEEISIQMRGAAALADPKVAKKLGLSDDQQKKLKEVSDANAAAMRELFQDGNREGSREKMQELRKQATEKAMAVLTADQKAAFAKMKGTEFKMPEGAFGPPGGGR
jgi:hypothetical protein